jgi:hypothetical protein
MGVLRRCGIEASNNPFERNRGLKAMLIVVHLSVTTSGMYV